MGKIVDKAADERLFAVEKSHMRAGDRVVVEGRSRMASVWIAGSGPRRSGRVFRPEGFGKRASPDELGAHGLPSAGEVVASAAEGAGGAVPGLADVYFSTHGRNASIIAGRFDTASRKEPDSNRIKSACYGARGAIEVVTGLP